MATLHERTKKKLNGRTYRTEKYTNDSHQNERTTIQINERTYRTEKYTNFYSNVEYNIKMPTLHERTKKIKWANIPDRAIHK